MALVHQNSIFVVPGSRLTFTDYDYSNNGEPFKRRPGIKQRDRIKIIVKWSAVNFHKTPSPPLVFLSSVSNLSADADKLAETVVPKGWPIKGEEKV